MALTTRIRDYKGKILAIARECGMGMKNEIVFTQSVRELCEKPLYIHRDSTNIYTFKRS